MLEMRACYTCTDTGTSSDMRFEVVLGGVLESTPLLKAIIATYFTGVQYWKSRLMDNLESMVASVDQDYQKEVVQV
jgi:hypothetical protein